MKAKKLSELMPPGQADKPETTEELIRRANKEEQALTTQTPPFMESGRTIDLLDVSDHQISTEWRPETTDDELYARFKNGLAAGNTPGRVLHDMKRNNPRDKRIVYRQAVKELIETHLMPPKVETAMIRAGRQKLMTDALLTDDAKTFAKLAALATKDPALNLQTKSPVVNINVGDLKEVMAQNDEAIEIDYEEDQSK